MNCTDSTSHGMKVAIKRKAKKKKNWRETEWIAAIFDYLIVDLNSKGFFCHKINIPKKSMDNKYLRTNSKRGNRLSFSWARRRSEKKYFHISGWTFVVVEIIVHALAYERRYADAETTANFYGSIFVAAKMTFFIHFATEM